eukprot:scaffold98699_cov69-Phaeocystis_antarctica.AAC.1
MSGTRPMVLIACARNIVSASSAQLARCSRPMPSQSRGWAPGGHATGAKSAPRLSRHAPQVGLPVGVAGHVLIEGLTSRAPLSMRGRHSHHDHGVRQGVIAPCSRRHA